MKQRQSHLRTAALFAGALLLVFAASGITAAGPQGQGTLTIIEPDATSGSGCPLEHTSVKADVSGFVAGVEVKQIFHNPRKEKIEAEYTFPLSSKGAVYEMLMKVGDRTVKGIIKRREEARRIYEEAKEKGRVASLLDQERPNIFTQSVANIMPGEKVEITIRYVEDLTYEDGAFKFVFPMVVGPRFIPGRPDGKQGSGWAKDTAQVPDASRITPPVAEEGKRAGHDIDVTVSLDAGVPIQKIDSKLHEVKIDRDGESRATVALKNKKEIPNRDFVLEYLVAGDKVRSGALTHKDGKDGYVNIVLIPPKRTAPEQIAPRELIFIVDTSGSQHGLPLGKCKETMRYVIERMNPDDTFNFIDFSDQSRMLFSSPKKNTPENREKVLRYIDSLQAGGGTRMVNAMWDALSTEPADHRLRIVTIMTDGLIGNDWEIISMIKKLRGTGRFYAFGTGNSVNRFLLDNMARVGGGEVDYILLNTPGEEVAKKFYERIATPVLTDIKPAFDGIDLTDIYPSAVSDLWSHKPLVFKARYSKAGKGTVAIKGFMAGKPYEQILDVNLPAVEKDNVALPFLWARAKVDDLMDEDLMGIQRGNPRTEVKEKIVNTALEHNLVTQFTSFVAVEETVVTKDGKSVKVTVPVELPDGVSREGIFGEKNGMPAGVRKLGRTAVHSKNYLPPTGGKGFAVSAMKPAAPRDAERLVAREVQGADMVAESADKPAASASRLSRDLADLVKMKDRPANYSNGKITVKEGKITVQVWLTKSGGDVIKLLKEKGLSIDFTAATGKMVIGEISVDKLEDLSKIDGVRLVEPFVVKG
ncbi:MAG: VIT and VWA domain-containing protein [Pseudomonadota bacterium]